MKNMKQLMLPLLVVLLFASCNSVKVLSDYDKDADFTAYKSYAFYKTGIDQAQISDLDKKRILRAIEFEMSSRGFVKSKDPDLLVSIFTRERDQVDVYNYPYGYGWGYGWGYWGYYYPYYWGPAYYGPTVSTSTEGSLYIDLIDANSQQLVWQGKGVGTLNKSKKIEKKEQQIQLFVSEILQQYPPDALVSN
jgi:hypothetical protein